MEYPAFEKLIRIAAYSISAKFKHIDLDDLQSEAKLQFLDFILGTEIDWTDEKSYLTFIYKHLYWRLFEYASSTAVLGKHGDILVLSLNECVPTPVCIDDTEIIVNTDYLQKLTDRQKQVFCMYVFMGYSEKEIADELGISRQAVNRLKIEAINTLREVI